MTFKSKFQGLHKLGTQNFRVSTNLISETSETWRLKIRKIKMSEAPETYETLKIKLSEAPRRDQTFTLQTYRLKSKISDSKKVGVIFASPSDTVHKKQ